MPNIEEQPMTESLDHANAATVLTEASVSDEPLSKAMKMAIEAIKEISPSLSEKEIIALILSEQKAFKGINLNEGAEDKKKMARGRPPRVPISRPRVWNGRNCFARAS